MKFQDNNNSITITLDNEGFNDSSPFRPIEETVALDSTNSSSNVYKELTFNKFTLVFSYQWLKKLFRDYNNVANKFADDIVKKATLNYFHMGSAINIVQTENSQYNREKEIESELMSQYEDIAKSTISLTINPNKILKTKYSLIFMPQGVDKINLSFIPKSLFDSIKKNQKDFDKVWYVEAILDFSLLSSQYTKDTTSVVKDIFATSFNVPMAKYSLEHNNIEMIFSEGTLLISIAQGTGQILEVKKAVNDINSFFLTKDEKNANYSAFLHKALFAKKLFSVFKLKDVDISNFSLNGLTKASHFKADYYYSEILTPIYLELIGENSLKFNICTDSDKRTKYGFFTKGFLNRDLKNDEAIDDKFNYFFCYDYDDNVKEYDVKQSELPYPNFK